MLLQTTPQGCQDTMIPEYGATLQSRLYSYYRECYLHDAFITVSARKVVSAHRLVLAAWSPVLHNTFSLVPEVKNILLSDYGHRDVRVVVEAMYTGILRLTTDNYQAVAAIIKKLEITAMEPMCEQFMNDKKCTPPSGPYGEQLKDSAHESAHADPLPIEIVPKIEVTEVQLPLTELENICIKTEVLEDCEEMDISENNSVVPTVTSSKASEGLNASTMGEVELDRANGRANDRANEPWNLGLETELKVERLSVTCHEQSNPEDTQSHLPLPEVKIKLEPNSPAKSTSDFDFFTCKLCGKKFPFYSNLTLHQRRHSQSLYRHSTHHLLSKGCKRSQCRLCRRQFKHNAAMLEHVHTTHFRKAQCKDCKRKFTSFIRLQDHRLRVHSKKHILGVCVCLQCCRVFRHQVNASRHTPCSRSTTAVTTCRHCNQKFRHQRFLQRHQTTCVLRDYVRGTMQTLAIGNIEDVPQQNNESTQLENGIKLECSGSASRYRPQHEDELFDRNVLGDTSPYQLLRTIIYMVDTYFTKLKDNVIIYREQVKVETDEKGTFVSFCDAKLTGLGLLKFTSSSPVKLYADEAEPKRCFVRLVKKYLALSPKLHDYRSPLFLVAKKEKAPCYWYNQRKQGSITIHKMLKETASPHAADSSEKNGFASRKKRGNYKRLAKPMAVKPMNVKPIRMLTETCFRDTNNSSAASHLPLPTKDGFINIAPIVKPKTVESTSVKSIHMLTETSFRGTNGSGLTAKPTKGGLINIAPISQCVINLNNWLQGLTGIANARELKVFEKLQIQPGGTIGDLPPCKLYFVLSHILLESRCLNGRNIFDHKRSQDRLLDCEALNHIRLHYDETATDKGYLFEQANIASLLNSKVERWYPPQTLPSPVALAAKGLIGDGDPVTLLRSVVFLLAAAYQLTLTDLQALTRATVVIDEDERGKYLCFCKNPSVSQNHAYIHEHTADQVKDLSDPLFFNPNELFTQAPLKIYAIKENPKSCLVHLMSRYLSLSIPIKRSLFCIPSKYAGTTSWFNQQAVGKRWITNALNQVLGEAGASVDSMFEAFHSQALEHGSPKLEACAVCSTYTKRHTT